MADRVIHLRPDAETLVAPHVHYVNQYRAVLRTDAQRLMCAESWRVLHTDYMCNLGPTKETLYPWNVIDYMCGRKPKRWK